MVDHKDPPPGARTSRLATLSSGTRAMCGEGMLQVHREGHFSALRDAARQGDLEVAIMLLKNGVDVDFGVQPQDEGRDITSVGTELTPLHEAAAGGHAAVVRALLTAGAQAGRLVCCANRELQVPSPLYSIAPGALMPHNQGLAPLHIAARYGHIETVRVLAEAGADVNVRGSFLRDTPLHLAATHGHLDVARLLVDKGADVNSRDRCGGTPLHLAKSLVVREFLLDSGADPNLVVNAPWSLGTPLQMVVASVQEGSDERQQDEALAHVRLLLEHGTSAKCDAIGTFRSSLPTTLHLSLAAFSGTAKIVSAMLGAGFDPNQADVTPRGRESYPIHYAARQGHVEILRLLLRAGARLNVRDQTAFNSTPLHLACRFTQVGAVRELLLWGADMAALDLADSTGEGRTPAGVISLRKSYRPNENSVADPAQDEDEQLLPEDAPPARVVGNRRSRMIGACFMLRGHLIGNRDDARDRNLIRHALRNEMCWRNRRGVILLKKRADQQPNIICGSEASSVAAAVDASRSGHDPQDDVEVKDSLCAGNTEASGDSTLSRALMGLLMIANLERALFRRIVCFL